TFGKVKTEEPVRETVDENEALQSHFTTEGTEDAEEGKTLPLMNADNTDKEKGSAGGREAVTSEPWAGPVELRLPPDLYRMDTQEGMEAYEASFRMKIASRLGGGPRPVIAHDVPAESHANLGSAGILWDTKVGGRGRESGDQERRLTADERG